MARVAAARVAAARVAAAAEAEEAIRTSRGNLDANPRAISADLGAISSAISRGYDGRGRLGRRLDAGGVASQRDARTGEVDGSAFATGVQLFTRPASAGCPPSSSAGYHPSSSPAWVYLGAARLSLRPHGPTVEVR